MRRIAAVMVRFAVIVVVRLTVVGVKGHRGGRGHASLERGGRSMSATEARGAHDDVSAGAPECVAGGGWKGRRIVVRIAFGIIVFAVAGSSCGDAGSVMMRGGADGIFREMVFAGGCSVPCRRRGWTSLASELPWHGFVIQTEAPCTTGAAFALAQGR